MLNRLNDMIKENGIVIGDDILKVDSFINHQIDTKLVDDLGEYFASKFGGVNKILTIETSGIAFGIGVARKYNYCPLVFAKKSGSKTLDVNNVYISSVPSFTKNITNNVFVDKKYLNRNDNVLIVDDFMADGNATLGMIDLCKQAGANIVGVAIVIEKGFQKGRERVEELGIKIESAAIVEKFDNGKVILKE